jgi:hypothetical protein
LQSISISIKGTARRAPNTPALKRTPIFQVTVLTDGVGAAKSSNENLGTFSFQRQLTGRSPAADLSLFHDAEIKAQGVARA